MRPELVAQIEAEVEKFIAAGFIHKGSQISKVDFQHCASTQEEQTSTGVCRLKRPACSLP